jgi:hypothetical protein
VGGVTTLTLILALPVLLALGAAAHALIDRGVKAVLWAASPLATGEPEAFTYERRVYRTADPQMTQIVAIAFGAGALFWIGLATGWGWFHGLGVLTLAGALALDLLRWERVAASANHLWFQRGFGSTVHQVLIENIRDVAVQETEVRGFTLRHGTRNRLARLQVRMADKRVIALPKTDAYSGLDDIEGVANHLRARLQQIAERQALRRSQSEASAAAQAAANDPAKTDAEIRRELRELRKNALAPDVPPALKHR